MLHSASYHCPISIVPRTLFFQPKTVPAWNHSQDPSKEEFQNPLFQNKKIPLFENGNKNLKTRVSKNGEDARLQKPPDAVKKPSNQQRGENHENGGKMVVQVPRRVPREQKK